jgi:hypothetical protein
MFLFQNLSCKIEKIHPINKKKKKKKLRLADLQEVKLLKLLRKKMGWSFTSCFVRPGISYYSTFGNFSDKIWGGYHTPPFGNFSDKLLKTHVSGPPSSKLGKQGLTSSFLSDKKKLRGQLLKSRVFWKCLWRRMDLLIGEWFWQMRSF